MTPSAAAPISADLKNIQSKFLELLDGSDVGEERVHQFIVAHPNFMTLDEPIENQIFSKLRLADQHTVDFAYARENSFGITWCLFEIESPWARRFTKAGNPSAILTHGLRQLYDWHNWFRDNRDYVRRNFPYQKEMGNHGITDPDAYLIIGRSNDLNNETRRRLNSMIQPGISVMSYDSLIQRTQSALWLVYGTLKSCRWTGRRVEVISAIDVEKSGISE